MQHIRVVHYIVITIVPLAPAASCGGKQFPPGPHFDIYRTKSNNCLIVLSVQTLSTSFFAKHPEPAGGFTRGSIGGGNEVDLSELDPLEADNVIGQFRNLPDHPAQQDNLQAIMMRDVDVQR